MKYEHPNLVICLLDGCNKTCKHCYRTMVPTDHGFSLDLKSVERAIEDAKNLETGCLFAGGEPTIWQDGGDDFLSIIIRAAKRNGRVAFLSNRHVFEDPLYCDNFIEKYLINCSSPILMMFSVDALHENYEQTADRINFVDNLLSSRLKFHAEQIVSFFIVSHWTNNPKFNVPQQILEKYRERGVYFKIDDFMVWGRAVEEIKDLSCYLIVDSFDKTTLGPFKNILVNKLIEANKIKEAKEIDLINNTDIIRNMHVCGKAPNYNISWGNNYYYCIPQMGNDWFSIDKIGNLTNGTIESFYSNRPILKEIQKKSIIGVIEEFSTHIPSELLNEIYCMKEGIRFAGCSLCMKLYQNGMIQEINKILLKNDIKETNAA